jgi:glycosyltransferase involved in cell wall biosynthesis
MKPRLLIFCPTYSSLVRNDEKLFSADYDVKVFPLGVDQKLLLPLRFIMEFFFLLGNISKTKIMVSRFVGYQTILPILFSKLTGKPVVCIMGGLECYSFPSIRMGSYIRPLLGSITKWCLRNATHLCPVHDSLVESDYTYQDEDFPKQGYKVFVPDCKTPYTVIRNGYDASSWKRTTEKIPGSFVTVAHEIDKDHISKLKGIDLILEVASSFPENTFTIVGGNKSVFPEAPANVKFTGVVKNNELHSILSTQEYYLQLSIMEGFPNALCEAMLCECIPVGSNVAAIPEIISDDKFILRRRDAEQLKQLLAYALTVDKKAAGESARKRIQENYTIERRKNEFLKLFSKFEADKNI